MLHDFDGDDHARRLPHRRRRRRDDLLRDRHQRRQPTRRTYTGPRSGYRSASTRANVAFFNDPGLPDGLPRPRRSPGLFSDRGRRVDRRARRSEYWRHEFRTYKEEHRKRDERRSADGEWHVDGTPARRQLPHGGRDLRHDRRTASVRRPGATPPFQLVDQLRPRRPVAETRASTECGAAAARPWAASSTPSALPPFDWACCGWLTLVPLLWVDPDAAGALRRSGTGSSTDTRSGWAATWCFAEAAARYFQTAAADRGRRRSRLCVPGRLRPAASGSSPPAAQWSCARAPGARARGSPSRRSGLRPSSCAARVMGQPWELLGYTQHAHVALIQVAAVTGVYGVSVSLASVRASRTCVAQLTQRRPSPAWSTAEARSPRRSPRSARCAISWKPRGRRASDGPRGDAGGDRADERRAVAALDARLHPVRRCAAHVRRDRRAAGAQSGADRVARERGAALPRDASRCSPSSWRRSPSEHRADLLFGGAPLRGRSHLQRGPLDHGRAAGTAAHYDKRQAGAVRGGEAARRVGSTCAERDARRSSPPGGGSERPPELRADRRIDLSRDRAIRI